MYIDPTGHWKQGDEDYNDETKAKLIALTNAYYDPSTTAEERKSISTQADALRTDSNKAPKVSPISIEVASSVTSIVDTAVNSRGWMTAGDWNKITSSMGITHTVNTQMNYSSTSVVKDTNVVTSFGRTDIGVNTSMNFTSNKASSAINMTYNLLEEEGLFVNQVLYNSGSSLEEAICLLDTLEMNGGHISKKDIEGIVGNNYFEPKGLQQFLDANTRSTLELIYNKSMEGHTINELNMIMTQSKLQEAYNFVTFMAACSISSANLNIYGAMQTLQISEEGYALQRAGTVKTGGAAESLNRTELMNKLTSTLRIKLPIPNATRLTPAEQATAGNFMKQTGIRLYESPHVGADYVDAVGTTYDALGTPRASQYWNQKQFINSIDDHLLKSNNFTIVDLNGFTSE